MPRLFLLWVDAVPTHTHIHTLQCMTQTGTNTKLNFNSSLWTTGTSHHLLPDTTSSVLMKRTSHHQNHWSRLIVHVWYFMLAAHDTWRKVATTHTQLQGHCSKRVNDKFLHTFLPVLWRHCFHRKIPLSNFVHVGKPYGNLTNVWQPRETG